MSGGLIPRFFPATTLADILQALRLPRSSRWGWPSFPATTPRRRHLGQPYQNAIAQVMEILPGDHRRDIIHAGSTTPP